MIYQKTPLTLYGLKSRHSVPLDQVVVFEGLPEVDGAPAPPFRCSCSAVLPDPPRTKTLGGYRFPGLVTNSILFCWLFTIVYHWKSVI